MANDVAGHSGLNLSEKKHKYLLLLLQNSCALNAVFVASLISC